MGQSTNPSLPIHRQHTQVPDHGTASPVPPAPSCPAWCTVDHAAQPGHRGGWDHVEATEAVKTCRRHVGTAEAEDSGREFEVVVDRFAATDGANVRVDAPKVVINHDADLMPSAARFLADALTSAAQFADGAEPKQAEPGEAAASSERRRLVTLVELAEDTGVSVTTWRMLERLGVGPQPLRVGGRDVWRLADVDEWRHRTDPFEAQRVAIGRLIDAFREVGVAFDWYVDRRAI